MLYGLWGVILFGFFLFWGFQRKKRMTERFADRHLVASLSENLKIKNVILKEMLLVVVLIFSMLALARPQWGFEWQSIKRQGLDIMILVDTSKSMLTEDVKPNRLKRTKLGIKDLVRKLKGDRIGLMAFSGTAFLVCPLTVDYGGFLQALEDLSTQTIPQGGTNLEKALEETLQAYQKTPGLYKAIVLITDGENLEGDPLSLARKIQKEGIKIFCVGVGTQEGELIRIPGEAGELSFLKDDQGNFVKSRLNENLLSEIARVTGGVYVRASGAEFGLDLIYDRYLSKMEKRDIEEKREKRYHERFQIPLALALLALMLETCIRTRKKT